MNIEISQNLMVLLKSKIGGFMPPFNYTTFGGIKNDCSNKARIYHKLFRIQ